MLFHGLSADSYGVWNMISLDELAELTPWLIWIWKIAGNYVNEKGLFGVALGEVFSLQTIQTGILGDYYVPVLFLFIQKKRTNNLVFVLQSGHNRSSCHNLVSQTKQTAETPKIVYSHLNQSPDVEGESIKHESIPLAYMGLDDRKGGVIHPETVVNLQPHHVLSLWLWAMCINLCVPFSPVIQMSKIISTSRSSESEMRSHKYKYFCEIHLNVY